MERHSARSLKAQATIEFTFVATILIVLLFAIMQFAIASYRKSVLDYRISHITESLPPGWDGTNPAETIRQSICDDSPLDAGKLALENVTANSELVSDVHESEEAEYFGAVVSTSNHVVVKVSCDASYPIGDGLWIVGDGMYRRHIDRTIRIEQREEIS